VGDEGSDGGLFVLGWETFGGALKIEFDMECQDFGYIDAEEVGRILLEMKDVHS
jgi:hypothetical protein